MFCPACGAHHTAEGYSTAAAATQQVTVEVVFLQRAVQCTVPCLQCSCGAELQLQPTQVLCFPATPQQVGIWYDEELLQFATQLRLRGTVALTSLAACLSRLHEANGQISRPAVWENLGEACRQWQRLDMQLQSLDSYRVDYPPGYTSHKQCPCCWRKYLAATFDSCLGFTRLARAAQGSEAIQPVLPDPRFLPDAAVADKLRAQRGISVAETSRTDCSKFLAASVKGRRSIQLHIHGLAAGSSTKQLSGKPVSVPHAR